jgi:hypothetical protein
MRRSLASLCCACLLATAASPGLAEDSSGVIIISHADVFGTLSRADVRFPHQEHWTIEGLTCLSCHHAYKDGKNVLDLGSLAEGAPASQCASCHTTPRTFLESFHLLCIGCHDTEKRQGKPTGPRECGECHAWVKR